ncbi:MAG: metalloregulator ArsR/SmtB family transcription factor [Gemmatimonadota bacterium]|jgi:ArsR family transcriptional regulator
MSLADARLAQMAKALGHPARVSILRVLANHACVCGDIVGALPLAQSTVSQHLKVLKEAGWITGAIDGPRTCYALNRDAIGELRSVLDPLLGQWEGAADCSQEPSCT